MTTLAGRGSQKQITCLVSEETKEWFRKEAKDNNVPMDEYVRSILVNHMKATKLLRDSP